MYSVAGHSGLHLHEPSPKRRHDHPQQPPGGRAVHRQPSVSLVGPDRRPLRLRQIRHQDRQQIHTGQFKQQVAYSIPQRNPERVI